MNFWLWFVWVFLKVLFFLYIRMLLVIYIILFRFFNVDVNFIWNLFGVLVILNGRWSYLYLLYEVCMVVIYEDFLFRGMWRKFFLMFIREKYLVVLSLWSCLFSVGIWCFGCWMVLFIVWFGLMYMWNFLGVFFINLFEYYGVGLCILIKMFVCI